MGALAQPTRPTITSHPRSMAFTRPRQRDSGFLFRLTFAADGGARPNSGGTPFRQPCPAYPSTKGRKAPQERFSEESFRTCTSSGNVFLYSSTATLRNRATIMQHTASLDVLAEPNYYSKCRETSSTHVFASHLSDVLGALESCCNLRRLLILSSASTLQVFHFIGRFDAL